MSIDKNCISLFVCFDIPDDNIYLKSIYRLPSIWNTMSLSVHSQCSTCSWAFLLSLRRFSAPAARIKEWRNSNSSSTSIRYMLERCCMVFWDWRSFFYVDFGPFSTMGSDYSPPCSALLHTLLPLLFILVPQKVVLSLFKLFSRSSLATLLPGFRAQISEFVWNVKLLSLLHFQIVYKFVFAMYLLCSPHTYFESNNRSIGNQKDSFLALSSKLIVLLALFRIEIITDCFDFIFPSSLLVGFPLLLQLRLSKGIMSAIFHVPKHVPYGYIQIWLRESLQSSVLVRFFSPMQLFLSPFSISCFSPF